MNGYYYYLGNLHELSSQTHWDEFKHKYVSLEDAIECGIVRIRQIGDQIAFQGRSKNLVNKAKDAYFTKCGYHPSLNISEEWPGHYGVSNNIYNL